MNRIVTNITQLKFEEMRKIVVFLNTNNSALLCNTFKYFCKFIVSNNLIFSIDNPQNIECALSPTLSTLPSLSNKTAVFAL